jgi:hypothetical protein
MTSYKDFDDWFYEEGEYINRSDKFFNDTQCPDPFVKRKVLTEWLQTAWKLGHESREKTKI